MVSLAFLNPIQLSLKFKPLSTNTNFAQMFRFIFPFATLTKKELIANIKNPQSFKSSSQ